MEQNKTPEPVVIAVTRETLMQALLDIPDMKYRICHNCTSSQYGPCFGAYGSIDTCDEFTLIEEERKFPDDYTTLIYELRRLSGQGVINCRNCLNECNWDLNKAFLEIRTNLKYNRNKITHYGID